MFSESSGTGIPEAPYAPSSLANTCNAVPVKRFFLLDLLSRIPIVGLVYCILIMVRDKKQTSLSHDAAFKLIWSLVFPLLLLILVWITASL